MRDTKEQSRDKIPVLGDLPVLGFLFRKSNERMRKTNLLLILTPYVIRDQTDLKRVFERKMQERQEFLDRYFVFTSDWEPPRDFSRTNGLVEDVRQAFFELEERERLEEETKPREEKFHEAGAAIELAGAVKGQGGGATANPAPKPATPKAAPKPKPKPKRPTSKKSEAEAPLNVNPIARRLEPEADPSDAVEVDSTAASVDRLE